MPLPVAVTLRITLCGKVDRCFHTSLIKVQLHFPLLTTQALLVEFCFLHKCGCVCYRHGTFAGEFLASSSVPSPRREDWNEAKFCYADELALLV